MNLVGWSLGGIVAREVARSRPEVVRRVVTYGSPVLGGPTHTVGAVSLGVEECQRITALQEHLDATDPIQVPVTAIFTRNDGAVDWRVCIDRSSLDVTMVEVASTHVGLGIDPDVWVTAVVSALDDIEGWGAVRNGAEEGPTSGLAVTCALRCGSMNLW